MSFIEAYKNFKLKEVNSVSDAVKEVPIHKHDMDIYFSQNNKLEREYQQLIERENNYSGDVSHNTDYFILDIEYVNYFQYVQKLINLFVIIWKLIMLNIKLEE